MANLKMTTKILLQRELAKRKITQKEFAAILDITEAYLSEILNDKKKATSRLFEFAEKLGVDLFNKTEPPIQQNKLIPVISWVHAGKFTEETDAWPVGVSGIASPVTSHRKASANAFGLIVKGDSMLPRLMPGDVAIIDPAIRCDNGSICVVWINGDVSIKLFWDNETEIILRSMNDKYPETRIKKDSKADFKVIGKVIDSKPKY